MFRQDSTLADAIEGQGRASSSQQTLIDDDLVKAAKAARDQAAVSLIAAPGRRTVAASLGRDDYEKVEDAMLRRELIRASLGSNGLGRFDF